MLRRDLDKSRKSCCVEKEEVSNGQPYTISFHSHLCGLGLIPASIPASRHTRVEFVVGSRRVPRDFLWIVKFSS